MTLGLKLDANYYSFGFAALHVFLGNGRGALHEKITEINLESFCQVLGLMSNLSNNYLTL